MNTLSKCKCQHCDQSIEFESAEEGNSVNCPGCGLETLLFIIRRSIPKSPTTPPVSTKTMAQKINDRAEKFSSAAIFICVLSVVVFLFTAIIYQSRVGDAYGQREANTIAFIGLGLMGSLLGTAGWLYLIAQIIHIRANTEKD